MTEYAAGWYPQEDGRLRYYDGRQWTDHFAPKPADSPARQPDARPESMSSTIEIVGGAERGPADVVESLKERSCLHKKAREALEQNLVVGETVEVIISGLHNQAIIGSNRRVFVYKKGFMAGASFGSELTSWEYRHLVGVQLHTGMMSGAVVLQGPGQAGTSTSYWKSRDSDPLKAPNAIPVARPWDQAKEGVARLRELIGAAHRIETLAHDGEMTSRAVGASRTPADTGSSESLSGSAFLSTAGEPNVQLLRDLAELRDAGILSQEEFETKKADVLRRL